MPYFIRTFCYINNILSIAHKSPWVIITTQPAVTRLAQPTAATTTVAVLTTTLLQTTITNVGIGTATMKEILHAQAQPGPQLPAAIVLNQGTISVTLPAIPLE